MSTLLQYPVGVGGTLTRVLESGSGDDVLLCLHGAGSRADRWRPAMALLAEQGFHVYAVDFPGHGLAAKPEGYAYGTPAFVEFVLGLLDVLELPAVSLLGTSLGGSVAARVALARPAQVKRVVLIGAVGLVPWDRPQAPIADGSPTGIRAKLQLLVHDHSMITDEWIREESRVNSSPGARQAQAALATFLANEDPATLVGERYAALGLPTLLMWGAQDRWVPLSVGERLAQLLPDSPLVLIEGTGHAPYFERPAAAVQAMTAFLR